MWPPEGPDCEGLIACCEELVKGEPGAWSIACQYAVARDASYPTALRTVHAIVIEQKLPAPAVCGR